MGGGECSLVLALGLVFCVAEPCVLGSLTIPSPGTFDLDSPHSTPTEYVGKVLGFSPSLVKKV